TLTRSLRPLERQGLVTMKPDRRDRRSRCLHLTAKGSAAFENAVPAWRRAQRRLEEALGGPEAAALNAAPDHGIERLAEERGRRLITCICSKCESCGRRMRMLDMAQGARVVADEVATGVAGRAFLERWRE